MAQEDPLSNEVSVSFRVEESGLSVAGKSRALAAADRLLGNLIDLPNALLERVSETQRAKNKLRIAIIEAATQKVLSNEQVIEGVAEQLLGNMATREIRALENKAAIVVEAIELAKEAANEKPDNATENAEPETQISDDWMNRFERYAEDASTDDMRMLWSRILANEIRRPGEFSLSAMRVASELDKELAETFERVLRDSFDGQHIIIPRGEVRGAVLRDYNLLQESGLITAFGAHMHVTLQKSDAELISMETGFVLRMTPKSESPIRLDVVAITRAGKDLVKIIPTWNQIDAFQMLVEKIEDQIVSARIDRIVSRLPNGRLATQPFRQLAVKSPETDNAPD